MDGASDEVVNTTPNVSLYGGSFIGAGAFGCVIRPPLLCKGQIKVPKKNLVKIAKITEKEQADHELAIANELRKIQMSKNYFTYPDENGACEPAPENKQIDAAGHLRKDIYVGSCRRILQYASLDYYTMFTMPYSGESYDKKIFSANFDYWAFGKHLLEGLSLLLVHGIVHQDLHRNNIVIDDYMVPRIIDWGKATQGPFATRDELQGLISNRPFTLKYTQEPPEIQMFVAAYNKRPSIDTVVDEMFVGTRSIVYDMQIVTGIDPQIMREQLEGFRSSTVFLERTTDFERWWKAHWHTYDIWGLGVVLLRMLGQLQRRINGFLNRREYTGKREKIIGTLRGMCNFNCFERLNAVQALAKWDGPNNPIVRRFGSKWL